MRERLGDIPLLVDYFIQDCIGEAQRLVTGVSKEVLDLFQKYSWPGNIRELRNIVRRAVFTGKSEWIGPKDLPLNFGQRTAALPLDPRNHDETVRECSRQLFVAALKACRGNRTAAMKMLGLERKKFYRLLRLHGLDRESADRGPEESDWILGLTR